jgi:(heptosyl)LPS beta-1,4-glucosyltransferase
MSKISAIVLGKNIDSELNRKCLESISWCDEIVNVDTKKGGSFSNWRNEGAKKIKNEWMLYIDTDEIVTPELKIEIKSEINKNKYSAYAIPRRNIIFGREMKHCGLWPDYVLRLIKKDKFIKWEGELHEQPKILGKIKHLVNPLIHYKNISLAQMVEKTNEWSEIEAKLMFEADHPPMNFLRFFSAALREFWLRMIVQTAFLDGTRGIIYAIYQVYSRLISYSKLWELQLKYARSNS